MFALAFLASIVSGHDPDIWFLVAAILFALAVVFAPGVLERPQVVLVPAGLALVAIGLLVT